MMPLAAHCAALHSRLFKKACVTHCGTPPRDEDRHARHDLRHARRPAQPCIVQCCDSSFTVEVNRPSKARFHNKFESCRVVRHSRT